MSSPRIAAAAPAGTALTVRDPWSLVPSLGNLEAYVRAVNQLPLLTASEELDLARRLRDHQDVEAGARVGSQAVAQLPQQRALADHALLIGLAERTHARGRVGLERRQLFLAQEPEPGRIAAGQGPAHRRLDEAVVVVVAGVVDRPAGPRRRRLAPTRALGVPDVRDGLVGVGLPVRALHVVEAIAEIPAGTVSAGRHTHPGFDLSYVLEGEGTLIVEGKPDQALKPGVVIQVPPNVPHDVKVAPGKPLKLLGIYVVEKGKPIASPAPLK